MNSGKYTIKEFLTFQNLEQIIIPEIQRDYVWKNENVEKLIDSILQDLNLGNSPNEEYTNEVLDKLPPSMREIILRAKEENRVFSNIGFVYAYYDSTQITKYILIDGQQRLTTLFLILLHLHIKEGKQDQFIRLYFKYNSSIIDYKVRENAHVFLYDFINYVLNGGDAKYTKQQYWYYSIYENDLTIQSILSNYNCIETVLSDRELPLHYIENQIEFWYFDTSKSEQGEDLYLYMNSRGESVQTNENIKAELLEYESELGKNDWGVKWETWQDLFWKNKGKFPNADRGLDEFLRWIKVISLVKNRGESPLLELNDKIRAVKENNKFTKEGLTLQLINNYYDAMKRILHADLNSYFSLSFIGEETKAIDYIKILPLLMYVEKYTAATQEEIKRYGRFFFNIIRFDIISKSPYSHIIQVIQLTNDFLENGYSDVVELEKFKKNGLYDNILTSEETAKLSLYNLPPAGVSRHEIEEAFWMAEDFDLCNGKIEMLWDCVNYNFAKGNNFDLQLFKTYFNCFKTLFENPEDILRRALLTKGDYAVYNGYTPSLGGPRYSFGSRDASVWREVVEDKDKGVFIKGLLTDYLKRKERDELLDHYVILNGIIDDYLQNQTEKNWIYYFVKNPKILAYCTQKMVCFPGEELNEIILLMNTKAVSNNYVHLKKYLN